MHIIGAVSRLLHSCPLSLKPVVIYLKLLKRITKTDFTDMSHNWKLFLHLQVHSWKDLVLYIHKENKGIPQGRSSPPIRSPQDCSPACHAAFSLVTVPLLPCAFWLKLGLAVQPLLLPDFLFVVSRSLCSVSDDMLTLLTSSHSTSQRSIPRRHSLPYRTSHQSNRPRPWLRSLREILAWTYPHHTLSFHLGGPSQIYSSPN